MTQKWSTSILVTFFGLAMLDWMFTVYFLEQGATEINPLLAPFIYDRPFIALLLKAAICGTAVVVFSYQWHTSWVRKAVIGVTSVYTVLVMYELVLYAMGA